MSLLEVEGLTVQIRGDGGTVTIVDGVDYEVEEQQIFGVHRLGRTILSDHVTSD